MRQHTLTTCLQTLRQALSEVTPLTMLLLLVVFASLFRYLHALVKILVEVPFIDFGHYYTFATLISLGLDAFNAHDVAQVDALLRVHRADADANYPPFFYLLMQPWVHLPFKQSALAWFFFSQLCVIGALALCFRLVTAPTQVKTVTVLFVWLNYQPLLENLALGQSNAVLLLLVTLAWWGLRTDHPWVTAAAVASTVNIKAQYGLLIVLLWLIGHRKASIRAMALAGLALGIGLVILGPAHHVGYVRYVLSLPKDLLPWTANISPRGTFHRLFEYFTQGEAIADVFWLALSAVILVVVARAVMRVRAANSSAVDWAWGLGLTAVLLLSPVTEEHHLVVLMLPITFFLLYDPETPLRPGEIAVLIGSIILLGARYNLDRFPVFHHGAMSLLATGKILGVFGLAWVLRSRLCCAMTPGAAGLPDRLR